MTFSDMAMMELGITQSTNILNTRSLICTLKYVLDILQTEEAFTVEEYKHTHPSIKFQFIWRTSHFGTKFAQTNINENNFEKINIKTVIDI